MTTTLSLRLIEGGASVPLTELDSRAHRLEVREHWRKQIHSTNKRLMRSLGLREWPLRLVEHEDGPMLGTVGVAGTLRIGSRELDIAPKHVFDIESSTWRQGLIAIMERIAKKRVDFSASNRLDLGHGTFADYFAFSFAIALDHATRQEPIRLYAARRELTPVLRGRLLIGEQMRSTLTAPHLLACEVDRLDTDNPINQLLVWAGQHLLSVATDGRVRRLLSHQLDKIRDVTITQPSLPLRSTLPRQFAHYSPAVDLATALARARGPHSEASVGIGAGFLVGTERMFERFVEQSLATVAQHAAWDVLAQQREPFAQPVIGNNGSTFFSKPDNVIRVNGNTRLVVDSKYKRFEDATDETVGSRPTNADLYQLAAAAVAHGCTRALLIYPRLNSTTSKDSPIRWWQVRGHRDAALRVGVVTVDLKSLGQRSGMVDFDAQLRRKIDEALQ